MGAVTPLESTRNFSRLFTTPTRNVLHLPVARDHLTYFRLFFAKIFSSSLKTNGLRLFPQPQNPDETAESVSQLDRLSVGLIPHPGLARDAVHTLLPAGDSMYMVTLQARGNRTAHVSRLTSTKRAAMRWFTALKSQRFVLHTAVYHGFDGAPLASFTRSTR